MLKVYTKVTAPKAEECKLQSD